MGTIDLIPRPDNKFDTFQDVLVAAVSANAVAWGIPAGDVTALTTQQTLWAAAWNIAKDKQNSTTAQRKAKDLARVNYEAVLRPFIQKWIYRNALMDDAAVEQCGLKPRDKTRTPAPVPETIPMVEIMLVPGNMFHIVFRQQLDEPGSTRRGKPAGVAYCEFAFVIGDEPKSPNDCTKTFRASRSPIKMPAQAGAGGQKLWFYARWINTRGKEGPWTTLDSFTIPF